MGPYVPGSLVRLETDRFIIRSMTTDDVGERYLAWLHDSEVTRFLQVGIDPPDLAQLRDYVAGHDNRDSYLLGIFTRSGQHIGNQRARIMPHHRIANLSVMIGEKEYWGRQVVLECRARVLDFLLRDLDLHKVQGGCTSDNRAAIFNYKRQGWREDGIHREQYVSAGNRVDLIYFAMFRRDWTARSEGAR